MSRLTVLAFTALAFCTALAACDPPPRLVIDGAVPFPPPDCLADLDAPRLTRTLVDVTQLTYGAMALLAVDSEPPEPLLFFTDAFVWFLDAPPGLPSSRASARIVGTGTTIGPQRPPPDGEDELVVVPLLTTDETTLLIDAPDGVLEARISLEGQRTAYGSKPVESEPLILAVDVCHGCLVASCVDQAPCVQGQDDPVGPPCSAR